MQTLSEVTPVTELHSGGFDTDVFTSAYANIRWGVVVDTIIVVDAKYEANLPGLAFDYYGNQEYWRAILNFNGLIDPISDVCVGTTLAMPSRSSIDQFMTSKNAQLTKALVL